jgi:hypothetical protein
MYYVDCCISFPLLEQISEINQLTEGKDLDRGFGGSIPLLSSSIGLGLQLHNIVRAHVEAKPFSS